MSSPKGQNVLGVRGVLSPSLQILAELTPAAPHNARRVVTGTSICSVHAFVDVLSQRRRLKDHPLEPSVRHVSASSGRPQESYMSATRSEAFRISRSRMFAAMESETVRM